MCQKKSPSNDGDLSLPKLSDRPNPAEQQAGKCSCNAKQEKQHRCSRTFSTSEEYRQRVLCRNSCHQRLKHLVHEQTVRDMYQSEFNDPYFEVTAELIGLNRYLIYASFSMLVAEDEWKNFGVECFLSDEELKALIADIDSANRAFPEKK